MKNKEPVNKKEIHAAILAAYEAVSKVQELVTPEVKAWADEVWGKDEVNEELVVDILNVGCNLVDVGNELDY
jgi:hypothetical protein